MPATQSISAKLLLTRPVLKSMHTATTTTANLVPTLFITILLSLFPRLGSMLCSAFPWPLISHKVFGRLISAIRENKKKVTKKLRLSKFQGIFSNGALLEGLVVINGSTVPSF